MDEIYIAGNSMQFAYRLRCTSGLWFCGRVELRWLQWQFKDAWQYCYGRANLLRIMTEPLHIQIVSDFVCPWCFVGKRRLDQALATRPELDVAIEWLPFQLSPDMPLKIRTVRCPSGKRLSALERLSVGRVAGTSCVRLRAT